MERKTMSNLLKKVFAMFLCVAAFLAATPANPVFAEGTDEVIPTPAITVTSTTVKAGDYAYFYVNASDFVNVAGLEYTLYYDADVMSVDWCYGGYMLSESSTSINTDTPGVIKCSVLNIDGINGSGELLNIGFRTNKDAVAGTYPLTLAVGDVYDTALETLTVDKTSGTLTIQESIDNAKEITFYPSTDGNWLSKGDTLTYRLYSGDTEGLTAGNFSFSYDEEVLELTDIAIGTELQTATSIYSINQEMAGYVNIAYADIESISDQSWVEYFVLTFTVLDDTSDHTVIEFSTNSLIDEMLGNLKSNPQSSWIYLEEASVQPASMNLVSNNDYTEDDTFTVDVVLSENANVAAGDFTITYDSDKATCTAVTVNDAVKKNNGLLIYKEDIGNGTVKFSYATTSPFSVEQTLVTLTFKMVDPSYSYVSMSVSGKSVVDADYKEVVLEYPWFEYYVPQDISNYWGYLYNEYYVYDGTAKEPDLYFSGLTRGIDFTVTYEDNVNAGTAKLIVKGIGNYRGTYTFQFTIVPVDLTEKIDEVALSQNVYTYDGSAKEPIVTIDGLSQGTDYTVSYSNNVAVGTAMAIITGCGNYTGTIHKEYTIEAASVAANQVALSQYSYEYDGSSKEPTVIIEGLTKDTDYTVTYDNNVNVGKAIARVSFMGNYTGTVIKEYVITAADLTGKEDAVVLSQNSFSYDGAAKEPAVTVSSLVADSLLIEGADYDVSYANNVNVGKATVTVTFKGNYTGAITKEYTITAAGLNVDKVRLSQSSYIYDGTVKEPVVTIADLTQGIDYTVTYKNNINAGTATVTITGMGNYVGTLDKTFTIEKANDVVTVAIADWTYGETANKPAATAKSGVTATFKYYADAACKNEIVTPSNAGTYYVKAFTDGNNNYNEGESEAVAFAIAKKAATITANAASKVYGEMDPILTATVDGTIGEDTLNYTLTRATGENVGTYAINVSLGENPNYDVIVKVGTFTISQTTNSWVKDLEITGWTYGDNANEPSSTPTFGEVTYEYYADSDCTKLVDGTPTVAGTYFVKATVQGNDNFTSLTAVKEFVIASKSISGLTIDAIAEQIHTGSAIEPKVVLKDDETILEVGTDYTVTYKDNVDIGMATATITGIGNYTGTQSINYEILCGHKDIIIDEAVPPTETETGLTEGKHCETCGEVLQAQQEIPAIGPKTAKIFGTVTSYGEETDPVTIELLDADLEVVESRVLEAGKKDYEFSISQGEYILRVSKKNHCPRDYEISLAELIDKELDAEILLYGDCTGDGEVDVLDVSKLSRHVAGNSLIQSKDAEYLLLVVDCNGDGEVDVLDVSKISRHVAGNAYMY